MHIATVSCVLSISALDGGPDLVVSVQRLAVLHLLSAGLDFGESMCYCTYERGQKRGKQYNYYEHGINNDCQH